MFKEDLDVLSLKFKILKSLKYKELVSLQQEILDFRLKYNVNEEQFLRPFQWNVEDLKQVNKVLNTAECYITYFITQTEEFKRLKTINVIVNKATPYNPKHPKLSKFNYLRAKDLGLLPGEPLLNHSSGK